MESIEWPPLVELVRLQPLIGWPENTFPEPFEAFLQELARAVEVPVELPAMLVLSVLATCVQECAQIEVKEGYIEPVNIWTACVLPPGSRKSKVFQEVAAPLYSWEREESDRLQPQIKDVESERKTYEARIKNLRRKAALTESPDGRAQLQQAIKELEDNIPAVLRPPRLLTGDVTTEGLGLLMEENGGVLSLLSDEGGVFDIIAGLYSQGRANIDILLQGHSASPVRIDRRSRSPILFDRAVLSMGLTIQPQVIRKVCRNDTFHGRGLLARFLFTMPESNIGQRTLDEEPLGEHVRAAYYEAINAILKCKQEAKKNGIVTLSFSKEAYNRWLAYAQSMELRMQSASGDLAHLTGWGSKLQGAVARIAALLHIARHYDNSWDCPVEVESVSAAIKIAYCLVSHAVKVFGIVGATEGEQIAIQMVDWIILDRIRDFTVRQAERKFRQWRKDELEKGFKELKERGYIYPVKIQAGVGRPSHGFVVNPELLA